MTIATFTFAFLCLAVGVSLGFFGGYRRALGKWTADVRKLEGAVEEKAKALKSAEVDMQIVRALRSGEIGVDDLHDVGFESVRQEATGALAPKQDGDPMPFVKLPYKRNLGTIKGMIPGDEMWIAMGAIRHRKDGTPTLWNHTPCASKPTQSKRTRLRFYGGQHELGIAQTECAETSDEITDASLTVDYTIVLRPEELSGF